MMTRILLIISILALNCFNSFSQTKNVKIDRMTISHNGDSLIPQKYELIIKSKKIYFITPVANHLHIKGEKYRTRVKIDKSKREGIFNLVDQLNWTSFTQAENKGPRYRYYIVEIFSADHSNDNFKVSEESLPSDFKKLYDTIINSK
jgi:hypothetical protein